MNSQFNKRVLIDLFVWSDDQNSSRHIIYVGAAWRGRSGQQGLSPHSGEAAHEPRVCSQGPALAQARGLEAQRPVSRSEACVLGGFSGPAAQSFGPWAASLTSESGCWPWPEGQREPVGG